MASETAMHEEREELRARIASWTEGPLTALGVVLLVVLVLEFAAVVPPAWQNELNAVNWFVYTVFAVDFVVQFALAPVKTRYLRRNWLAAVSVALPAFRVFRVLRAARALRGLRLVRVVTATNRGTRALSRMLRGSQFGRVLGLTVAVVAVGAAALVAFETDGTQFGARYSEALWWAVGFVVTVGTDFQPRTFEGRVVSLLLMVWGLGVFGYLTGAVASYFVGQDATATGPEREIALLRREVAELKSLLIAAEERGTDTTTADIAPRRQAPLPPDQRRP